MSTPEAVQNISHSVHAASRPSHTVTRTADVSSHTKIPRRPEAVTSRKTVPKKNPAVRKLHVKKTLVSSKMSDSSIFAESSKNVLLAERRSPAVSRRAVEDTLNSSTVTTSLTRVSVSTPAVCTSVTTVIPAVSNSVRVVPLVASSAQDILADQVSCNRMVCLRQLMSIF